MPSPEAGKMQSSIGKKSEQRVDNATADSSAGAETFESQRGELRSSEEKAYLIRQQLNEPPVTTRKVQ